MGEGAFLSDLLAGLAEPSAWVLVAGLTGGLLGSVAWIRSIDADYIAANPGMLAATDIDEGPFGTARLIALQRSPPDEPPILLLGGSSVREALTSIPDFTDGLRSQGVSAPVHVLAGLDRYLWQTEALIALAPDVEGLLILPIDATQLSPAAEVFDWDANTPRYGVELPVLDDYLANAGFHPGPLAARRWLDARSAFVLARAWYPLRRAFSGPLREEPQQYNRETEKRPSWAYAAMGEYFRTPSPLEVEGQLVAATALIERARNKGYDIVLLRTPRDRSYFSEASVVPMDAADQALDEWATGLGLDWWDPGKEAQIRPDELYDWCHIFHHDAEVRWTAALTRSVVARWKERHP